MRDIKSPGVIWAKGFLFLGLGIAATILLLVEIGTAKGALLLLVSIWAMCRAYYFAFYVIEKYVDPGYRFSGLISFLKYVLRKKRND